MNKTILKKFAIESRQDLMQRMENKIKSFYVDEEFAEQQNGEVYILTNSTHSLSLSKTNYNKRKLLLKRINELGLDSVVEEAAYTWFNRIVAIRYMELHDYLPLTKDNHSLGIRVLSSKDNTPDPEIMKFTNLVNPELDIGFEKERYVGLKDDNEKFKYILLLVCKKLGRVIPQVFDGTTDYIDILIPDNLLNESGFVNKIVAEIPVENYEQVEIIGWLYQYYNQTEKERVISAKKTYKKNEIPYATQLFTPDWIVKYMVENTLGKYWIEHNGNCDLTQGWKYYIKSAKRTIDETIDPIYIKCIDPCSGSGHILVYMFEILFQIYLSFGYSKADIPGLILKYNLYGIDIDDRAEQLSILSVILKAREFDKDIFNKNIIKKLNIISIKETNKINENIFDIIDENKTTSSSIETIKYVYETFKNAKEIGSLINIKKLDYEEAINEICKLKGKTISMYDLDKYTTLMSKYLPILKQAQILSQEYDIVITNPPYMGEKYMPEKVKKYVRSDFFIGRTDLFSVFMLKAQKLCKKSGMIGMITPYSWMFLDSYKELRKFMIDNMPISSLIQLEFNAFEVAALPVCAFTLLNDNVNLTGNYIKLSDFPGADNQPIKVLEALKNNNVYYFYKYEMKNFKVIDGFPISFWLSDNMRRVFATSEKISNYGISKQGMVTGDNKKFLRLWFEPDFSKLKLDATSLEDAKLSHKKWFPYNKGGKYRKWYGNNEYVVNYENDGEEVKEYTSHLPQGTAVRIKSRDYYFKEAITWTFISIDIGVRYSKCGAIFDVAGSSLFVETKYIKYILGFMCTKLMKIFNQILNPTMNVQTSNVAQLPIIIDNNKLEEINNLVNKNIEYAKADWDSYELSWDFDTHPLIKYKNNETLIEKAWENWNKVTQSRFNAVKENEQKLNEIFIDIYGLKDEIDPTIDDKDITIRNADIERDIKSFINYSVGCMFGRYSIDKCGLICAGGEYIKNNDTTFLADEDNVIPITESNYFSDDIIARFKAFLQAVYGKETLYNNLDFIAETIGKKNGETSEETIRRYFINDFFSDHCNTYSVLGSGKRPIYWLFDSGKKNGFKCLIYIHRYNEGTISKIRLDYLHKMQNSYKKELDDINLKLTYDISLQDKRELVKRQSDINSKLQETMEYDEKIAHIADKKIKIDLDDGVILNYSKFSVKNPKTGKDESILAKIK